MSVFDGRLSDMDAEQSQATELIRAALEQSPEPSESRDQSRVMESSKDTSTNSFPSSKNSVTTSARQYHFHGLASTQTQTQLYGEEDKGNSELIPNEGSQKENYGATGGKHVKDIKWGMPSPDSRPSSPHGLAVKDNAATATRSEFPRRLRKSKSPTVPFQPPTRSPISQQMTDPQLTKAQGHHHFPQPSRQRNSRSDSPDLSQDSFAQDDSRLFEEKFLVTSKKFTMPLADLARADEDDCSIEVVRRERLPRSSYLSRTVPAHDDHPPVILVPSTPSHSGSSDYSKGESSGGRPPPPQHDDSFEQGQSTGRLIPDSDSSRGSQYSQGFDDQDEVAEVQNLYSSKRDTKPEHVHPQLHSDTLGFGGAQQATQIATQEVFMPMTSSIVHPTNTSTHTGPRSLLSTMDPHKRNRYQHLVQYTPASPISPAQLFPAGTRRLTADGAETQPAGALEQLKMTSSHPVPESSRVPSPWKASPKKSVYKGPQLLPTVDAMDVVPDSEPMREVVQTSVSEERLMDIEGLTGVQQGGQISKRPSHDSETTEDSEFLPPKKIAQREEKEEGEEEAELESAEEETEGIYGRKEEGGDDDDDDEPLSARLRKGKGKAPCPVPTKRGKAAGNTRIYSSKAEASKKASKTQYFAEAKRIEPPRQQQVQKSTRNIEPINKSHEDAVPSSVPDQDHPRTLKSSLKSVTALKGKGKQPLRKASRAISVTRSTRSHRSTTAEVGEEDPDVEMEEVPDSERVIEPTMDEEGDEYMEPEAPLQNLKRKRGRPPKSKSLNATTITPRTRLTKRLKSAGSTISRVVATPVFALWSQNGLYYSGIVHEEIDADSYNIKFDDSAEEIVSTENIRTHNLRVGDFVRINVKAKDYKVVKLNHRTNMVSVDISGEVEELPLKDISISTKVITSMWQDRHIDKETIIPIIRLIDTKPAPSPSRSTASFLNVKGSRPLHKFLQKVGLIVSLSGNNTSDRTKDGRSRSDILGAVRDSGGVVVDDLFKYLRMDISYSSSRWIGELNDVQWVGEPKELQRLFLLADDCNLKPKYLMALALGIPCLSINWLYSCLEVGKELDWWSYLLPQGRPTTFDVLPSQQIDLNWGDQPHRLLHIMTNPVAPRILKDQSVLCVGPDMTPKSKDTDKAGEAANYIIRIILAMGATRVEAVRDPAYALYPLPRYDLLVIREKDHYNKHCAQTRTVDWNWIKDSLIMSRLLPYPEWPREEESQCSQSL